MIKKAAISLEASLIGDLIADRCFSIREYSRICGVSHSVVSRFLSGRRTNVRLDTLVRMCRPFGGVVKVLANL